MARVTQLIKTVVVTLLFGFVIANVEPYPHGHHTELFAAATASFIAVAVLISRYEVKGIWLSYGLATVICYAVPFGWFWFGTMTHAWWYPPQPPIIQLLFFVDGEATYDAMVANFFLVLWAVTTAAFVVRYLTHYSSETPNGAP